MGRAVEALEDRPCISVVKNGGAKQAQLDGHGWKDLLVFYSIWNSASYHVRKEGKQFETIINIRR